MLFTSYRQHDRMDCGPTCLRMVAKHYRKTISIQYLRERCQIGKEGTNMLGISDAAESIGFRTKTVIISLDSLCKEALLPAILFWNQNHFVVIYKIKKNKFYVADPSRGLLSYSKTDFKLHWLTNNSTTTEQGIALLLEPTPDFYALEDHMQKKSESELSFNKAFSYLFPYKKLILQLCLGLCISSILQLIIPFLTQSVVDVGINGANIHFIYVVLFAQIALFTGRLVVDFIRSWILLHISTRINISILTDFLIKLIKLPLAFFDSKRTGDILQRMNDHQRIESFLTGSSLDILFSFINLIIFSIVLSLFNFQIFVVVFFANIIYALWVAVFLKQKKILDNKRFDIASQKQSISIQMIQGMQEVKLHGCEKHIRWAWERVQAKLFKLSVKSLALSQWQQSGAFLLNEGKNIFVTFLSAKAVIEGDMTLGTMLAVQYIIGQINNPINQMIGFVGVWQNAKISMERLNEIHNIEDEEPAYKKFQYELPASYLKRFVGGTETSELSFVQEETFASPDNLYPQSLQGSLDKIETGSIFFNNVSFTYAGAGNEPVLKNITLNIPIGKTTAIVGTSGSGKTTILKLLLRFYDPEKGEIKLDKTSLTNISHSVWRSHCGVVMQDSFIFSDTIAKNIAIGIDYVDMERLVKAATLAKILDFIESLPLSFSTKIGAEGIGISAGQKQRLLIARAIYKNPEFILLDEATNSLDANNEKAILVNLNSFFKGKTVIVVAHRLSTVKSADQIILLNKGVIEERGTHYELINLKGAYYTLIKNQLELGD